MSTPRQLREFVRLPEQLYRGDPLWAPPLWLEERGAYRPGSNPVLARSDHALFLAFRGREARGRILAYVDPNFNAFYGSAVGFFGALECVPDQEAFAALIAVAERWLAGRGMSAARGPIHPVAEYWGLLLDGPEGPPVFLTPYNPRWYNDALARLGYAKVKDLVAYEGDARRGYRIPERFLRFRQRLLARRPALSVRRLDMRHLMRDAEHIWRISNGSLRNNWGYVPLERDELGATIARLKPIADPDAVWFVEDAGVPVAYCLGFPDLNVILRRIRGRLLPFGFLHLLLGVRRLRDYRLWGLAVLPEYHSMGLDALLYLCLYEALAPKGVRLEANYVLEDNLRIRNALEKLGLSTTKVYRVYQKPLPAGRR